jgi:hypothetical protein
MSKKKKSVFPLKIHNWVIQAGWSPRGKGAKWTEKFIFCDTRDEVRKVLAKDSRIPKAAFVQVWRAKNEFVRIRYPKTLK